MLHRRLAAPGLLVAVVVTALAHEGPRPTQEPAKPAWVALFNGKDLTGWETALAARKADKEPFARNKDPRGVFTVVPEDGGPAIRISGDGLGGLTTLAEYENYHLELEFKWGEKRFPPRARAARDSGVLYHCVGDYNPATGWLESPEFGLLEGGETGDFWSVPGPKGARVVVDVVGEDVPPGKRRYKVDAVKYKAGGKAYSGTDLRRDFGAEYGIQNGDDNEKPRGQWNKLDLICHGQTSVHAVNGTVNLVLTNIRRTIDGREEPLAKGRIQLQCEGAEVFFRNVRLRPITAIPTEFQRAVKEPPPNTLTAAEKADGWKLLFDGEKLAGWRGYRKRDVSAGWGVVDGTLACVGKAGDLVTEDTFRDFELAFDWRIGRGGNSGVFYRATEGTRRIYENAPEYELRDNDFWKDNPYTAAANYGLHPPGTDAARPVGYWNRGRIVARGNAVEHWLNGEKVVAYDLHSAEWAALVRKNLATWPEYGKAAEGHIGLQSYGDPVRFRNVKLRPLAAPDSRP